MIHCNYTYNGSSISRELLYNLLTKALNKDATIEDVLFSRATKLAERESVLEKIKESGKLDHKKSSSLLDGDVSYVGPAGEYSISLFLDSPLAVNKNGTPVYQQRNIDDYRKEELKILTEDEGLSEKDANEKIDKTIANWDKVAEDSKILHQLCIDYTIGYHEKDWDELKSKFVQKALTLIKADSPFRNVELLKNLYVEFAKFYRNIKGLYPDAICLRNIGLSAKLKDIDSKIFGHIDYIFIDSLGKIHIYNFKVTSQNPSKWASAKKEKYKLEGAFIKLILIANGITVDNIGEIEYNLVPLKVNYDEDFNSIKKITRLDSENYDFTYGNKYSLRKHDNIARLFIQIPFNISTLNERELNKTDNLLLFAFPFMKISSERTYKSTLLWIKEAPSFSETDSLVIKEVNEPNCRYRVVLYDETYDIKDFTKKENNLEIIKLVQKHLSKLNSELGDYSSKIAVSVQKCFKHKTPYLEELQNSSFISGVLAKYLPKSKEDKPEWELNTDLIEYNILLFKNINNELLDIVDITSEDLQQIGDFRRGASNLLGSYKLDGNKDASTLKGDMGNVELIRTMILLNLLLPSLGNPKLGEITVLSTSKNGQSRKHYIENFNKQHFSHFLKIIKQENGTDLIDVKNNFSNALYTNIFDDVIDTYNKLVEGLSEGQKAKFENLGFNDLPTVEESGKVLALFDILQELHNGFLSKFSVEEIYNIAHPRLGSNSNLLDLTAALLYELVSKAYQHYSGQNIKYELNLSAIDINAFTAPTIPDYNVRLVVNNMQTALDSIAFNQNKEYEQNIYPIVMEYYKACGYTDILNLTLGNQLHLFDNLYLRDEKGNKLLIFKNPYDDNNDLKSHERLFLKKALFYINKIKLNRFTNSKEIFSSYNDPEIAKYIKNDKKGESYLWVPLTRASKASKRQQSFKGRIEEMKRIFRIFTKSEDRYYEMVERMTPEEKRKMEDGLQSLTLKNPFDIGEELSSRLNFINNLGIDFFETNVENILSEYMAKAVEVEKLNKFLVGTKSLLLQLHIMGNDSIEAQQIVEKENKLIKDYIQQNIFNLSTMDKKSLKVVGMLSGAKREITFLNLAGNLVSFFRDTINGFMENFLRSVTKFLTDIKSQSLTEAYKYVITNGRSNAMNINLLSKLNVRYRLSNTDLARIKERLRTGRNGVYNWDNWAYSTLRSPDFLNRMTLFVARCMQDGVWDAYSLKDGELYYDVKKDKRFQHFLNDDINHPDYKKEKALFILHVQNWNKEHPDKILDWADKKLPEPYSDLEILAIKNVANNIYGSYDKSLKAQYEHTAIGWAFGMYTTWMNGIWNNWAMKPGEYNIHNMETRIQTDENGNNIYMEDNGNFVTEIKDESGNIKYINKDGEEISSENLTPVLEQIPVITQGILYSLRDAFNIFRDKGLSETYKYILSNEVDKRNLAHASSSLLIAILFALLFKLALTPAYKESKKKSNDLNLASRLFASVAYRSLNGARDSFAGPLNIIEYFGEQTNPPLYKVPVKLITDTGKTLFGDKTFKQLLTGNIAIARTFKDIALY